jgi:hypothetical protein
MLHSIIAVDNKVKALTEYFFKEIRRTANHSQAAERQKNKSGMDDSHRRGTVYDTTREFLKS